MSCHERPLLLGYIRADLLTNGTRVPQVRAQLEAFADREEFCLGTVFVADGDAPAAFHALMDEMTRDEAAWGVVVPDLRHLTVVEQLVLSSYEDGAQTAIFAATLGPRAGGPGEDLQTLAGPAVPRIRPRPGDACTSSIWS